MFEVLRWNQVLIIVNLVKEDSDIKLQKADSP